MIPKPDGLTSKILNNSATVEDFIKYDQEVSSYLTALGVTYLETEREEIKRFYCFLSIIIQQFKEFLTFVASVNCNFSYHQNKCYTQYEDPLLDDMFLINNLTLCLPAKFMLMDNEKLPIYEVKLLYTWLSTIIDMEETFSPNISLFSGYNSYLTSALEELCKQKFYV